MATTTISAGDLTKLRGSHQWIDDLALHITPLVTIQSGTITAVPSTVPYINVTWDGSTSGIEVGQMVKITNGTTIRAYGVIRKLPSGSTLFISSTSLGNPGYTGRIESPIQVGDTATVYSHHPLWGLFSTIRQRVFYKSFDIPYTDQNESPPPVANAGTWQAARIASGATAAFTLPRSGVNTDFAFGAATITARLWTLPAGVSLQAGFSTSDAVIGVDAVAGTHLLKLKVTDSSGKVHTAYVWLFVSDGTTGTSLSERFAIDIAPGGNPPAGRTISFIATGTGLDDSVLYPGAGILLREWPLYNGNALSDGVSVDTFVGYITDVDYESDGDIGTATVTAVAPIIYAEQVTQPPQRVTEKASPSNWTEAHSVLTNPRGLAYYIIKWHCPALLDMHDYDVTLTTPRKRDMRFDTDSLGAALQVVAQLITGNIGSASDGTTVMRRNPVLETNTTRNALDTVLTWTDEDLKPELRYRLGLQSKAGKAYTGAFIYDGSTTKAHRAVKRWYQGVGEQTLPDFIATVAQGLTYILEKVGHFMALQNRDIADIDLPLLRNQDVIDPAYMLWNGLTSSSDYDPRGIGFTNERVLPVNVERSYSNSNGSFIKDIVVTVQPETFGQPGEEYIVGSAMSGLAGGWFSTTPLPYTPQAEDGIFGTGSIVIAINETGKLAVTYSLLNSDPEWISLNEKFSNETVCDADWDFNSDFIVNGYVSTDALGLYVCTIISTLFKVYYIPDVLDPASVPELLDTQTMPDSSADTNGVIACSETTPTLVVAAWKDQTGVRVIRSTDGGDNWTVGRVGSSVTDTDNDDAPIGLAIWGTTILCTGPDGSSNYGLYKATSGGSFSLVTNSNTSDAPLPIIRIASTTNALTTTEGVAGITIDFDSGHANSQDGTFTTFGEAAVGNPGNALQGIFTGTMVLFAFIRTTIILPSSISITNVALDYYLDTASFSTDWIIEIKDGGVLQETFTQTSRPDTWATWETKNILDDANDPSALPVTGDEVIVTLKSSFSGGSSVTHDWRMDNIVIENGTTTTVDFEGVSYILDYLGTFLVTAVAAVGNPGNAGQGLYTGVIGTYDGITVIIDLPSSQNVSNVALDYYLDTNTGGLAWRISARNGGSFVDSWFEEGLSPLASWVSANIIDDAFDPSGLPVTADRIIIELERADIPGASMTHDFRLDNIIISGGSSADTLYKVATYSGSSVWTGISPSGGVAPLKPYALSIDFLDSDILQMTGSDNVWRETFDLGTSWTNNGASVYRTFLVQNDVILGGGAVALGLLTDGGISFDDKLGNLATAWGGSVGTIRKLLAL